MDLCDISVRITLRISYAEADTLRSKQWGQQSPMEIEERSLSIVADEKGRHSV